MTEQAPIFEIPEDSFDYDEIQASLKNILKGSHEGWLPVLFQCFVYVKGLNRSTEMLPHPTKIDCTGGLLKISFDRKLSERQLDCVDDFEKIAERTCIDCGSTDKRMSLNKILFKTGLCADCLAGTEVVDGDLSITVGSGNVFEDLGLPDAAALQFRSQMLSDLKVNAEDHLEMNPHIGSSFDDFLKENGDLEHAANHAQAVVGAYMRVKEIERTEGFSAALLAVEEEVAKNPMVLRSLRANSADPD